jgi:hypothetical protein
LLLNSSRKFITQRRLQSEMNKTWVLKR